MLLVLSSSHLCGHPASLTEPHTHQTSLRKKIVQALPEGYPALGWVVHTNCSFRGSQMPRCLEEADKHGSCTFMLLSV